MKTIGMLGMDRADRNFHPVITARPAGAPYRRK